MNWKKSDIPLVINGFFVGMLFWEANGLELNKINLLHILYFAGAYLTIIAYGEMVKNEDKEK
jgi:hypothetical protein